MVAEAAAAGCPRSWRGTRAWRRSPTASRRTTRVRCGTWRASPREAGELATKLNEILALPDDDRASLREPLGARQSSWSWRSAAERLADAGVRPEPRGGPDRLFGSVRPPSAPIRSQEVTPGRRRKKLRMQRLLVSSVTLIAVLCAAAAAAQPPPVDGRPARGQAEAEVQAGRQLIVGRRVHPHGHAGRSDGRPCRRVPPPTRRCPPARSPGSSQG